MPVPSSAYLPHSGIGPEQVAFYREQGYLIGERLLSDEEITALRDESVAIFRGERGASAAEVLK